MLRKCHNFDWNLSMKSIICFSPPNTPAKMSPQQNLAIQNAHFPTIEHMIEDSLCVYYPACLMGFSILNENNSANGMIIDQTSIILTGNDDGLSFSIEGEVEMATSLTEEQTEAIEELLLRLWSESRNGPAPIFQWQSRQNRGCFWKRGISILSIFIDSVPIHLLCGAEIAEFGALMDTIVEICRVVALKMKEPKTLQTMTYQEGVNHATTTRKKQI